MVDSDVHKRQLLNGHFLVEQARYKGTQSQKNYITDPAVAYPRHKMFITGDERDGRGFSVKIMLLVQRYKHPLVMI